MRSRKSIVRCTARVESSLPTRKIIIGLWDRNIAAAGRDARDEDVPAFLDYWYVELDGTVHFANEDYGSYKASLSEFEGGLHPDAMERWGVWSLRETRPVKIADFFGSAALTNVLALAREDAARRKGYADYAQYAEERLISMDRLPENFVIDDKGVEFLYNPYEAACGAEGEIRARVSWEEVRPHLRAGRLPLPVLPRR